MFRTPGAISWSQWCVSSPTVGTVSFSVFGDSQAPRSIAFLFSANHASALSLSGNVELYRLPSGAVYRAWYRPLFSSRKLPKFCAQFVPNVCPLEVISRGTRAINVPWACYCEKRPEQGVTSKNTKGQTVKTLSDLGFRAPSGTRTPNPLIKSQLLCQLS